MPAGLHGTHEWVPFMTAKHQPTPWYSQAWAPLSAPLMCSGFVQAGALWGVGGGVLPAEPRPSRGNRQRFGLAVIWVGFLVWGVFLVCFPFYKCLSL